LQCIDRIGRYCEDGEARFMSDQIIQDATLRNRRSSESAQRVSAELRGRHSEINWRALAGFRKVLVHDYVGLSVERIWHIVASDLPVLKRQMDVIRLELEAC
jgi:uncharacterized protein with HEPN domain